MFMNIKQLSNLETSAKDEGVSIAIAAVLHALLLFWNPMMLRSGWQAPHDFVTIDVVDENANAPMEAMEKPQKMSLMDTLKDMLAKPAADLAGPAPKPDARPAPMATPVLQEKQRSRMSPTFIPKSQTDELAMAQNPDTIAGGLRNMPSLPSSGPTLKAKAFDGIRAKDLPFAVSNDALAGAQTVNINVGNRRSADALKYTSPALQEANRRRVGIQGLGSGASNDELAALGRGPSAAPIAIAGSGGTGNAPAGGAGASLNQRAGTRGGLISAALTGRTGSSSMSAGQLPSAAQDLEAQIAASGSNRTKAKSRGGIELTGPIQNRAIMRKVIPQYPSWAEERGLTGTVRLYFTVSPEGSIRSTSIRVTKTTGSLELDQVAIDALKQWQFAPLSSSDEGKGEWGIITFTFALSS